MPPPPRAPAPTSSKAPPPTPRWRASSASIPAPSRAGRPARDAADRSTRPHRLAATITGWEEALILERRRSLTLPLDDVVEAMRRCVNPQLSRRGVHRCLQRHGWSARLTPQTDSFQTDRPVGFIHIGVKYLPPLNRQPRYAYSLPQRRLGSRSTARPALSISKSAAIVAAKPLPASSPAFSTGFPLPVHTILTDNGSQFTDRFAVDKKENPTADPRASRGAV